MAVANTMNLQYPFQEVQVGWARARGTVGWPYIPNEGIYDANEEGSEYAEVVGVSSTTITVRTYYYELYIDLDGYLHHIGDLPDPNVSMSYSVLGTLPSSGVGQGQAVAASLAVWPNPADHLAKISLGTSPGSGGRRAGVFGASGRLVRELDIPAEGTVIWNLTDEHGHRVPNGIYFVGAIGQHRGHTSKMLVVR
jgi:hypothetical protein